MEKINKKGKKVRDYSVTDGEFYLLIRAKNQNEAFGEYRRLRPTSTGKLRTNSQIERMRKPTSGLAPAYANALIY